ncbi:MAG: SAM-dependent methyltransferase [Lentimicrobium sp.]|jgi:16S rRNA (cytidine1402-2'-O)-methyltransferase
MKPEKGKLYLIPATLGDTPPEQVLPAFNLNLLQYIDVYVVEELKTARRFLRKCGYRKDFDSITEFYQLNEHTSETEIESFLEPALSGRNTGLVSEAGCPAVADPGSALVRLAHAKGIQVVPLSGPSSLMLSLMASGFNGQQFTFHGYLPVRPPERIQKLREIERETMRTGATQIFIETPYRNRQMLESIISTCSDALLLCIALNLTLPDEKIITRQVAGWKKAGYQPPRVPAVFLLSRQ